MLVLVADDDRAVREALERALQLAGYDVELASDGDAALAAISQRTPDAVVLDVMMPGYDGLDVTRRLRREGNRVPVLLLTARDAVGDRVDGLDAGADDYLPKPFALEELLARVRAVLRRTGRLATVLEAGDLLVDESGGWATQTGRPVPLTATELRLLAFLVRHRGQALSKDQLLTQVWGYDAYDPNLVEVHVSALRRKLEERGPRMIQTVRGIGYRFAA
jgi:DNA-binding response OmpR family regulator